MHCKRGATTVLSIMRIPVVIRILFLSLLTLFLSGCLQIQQVIEIRKENKGSFKLEISLPLEIYQKFIAGDKVPEAKYFDPVKGTAYFAATDGFRIKKYRVFDNAEEGGAMRKYIQVEGDITDVKKALASGKLGDFAEAHRLFLELMELQIQQTGDTHDTVAYWLNGHGDLLANMGATALADAAFLRAMEIYEIIDKPKGHFDLSVTLVGLGKVARDRGDLVSAETLMRQGLDIRIDTISEAHSFTQLARIDLADVIRSRGRLDDARATFNEAIANLENNGDAEHPHVAQAMTGLAKISIVEGNPREAIALLERSIAMTEAAIGREHLDNVNRRLLLA